MWCIFGKKVLVPVVTLERYDKLYADLEKRVAEAETTLKNAGLRPQRDFSRGPRKFNSEERQ